jgi:hypothetical protein
VPSFISSGAPFPSILSTPLFCRAFCESRPAIPAALRVSLAGVCLQPNLLEILDRLAAELADTRTEAMRNVCGHFMRRLGDDDLRPTDLIANGRISIPN